MYIAKNIVKTTSQIALIILTVTFICGSVNAQTGLQSEVNSYLKDLPFSMPEIKLPHFPDKEFIITNYGAKGDGHTMNTEAFKKAIDACSEAGGGRVIVPPGIYISGPIELKSNVDFHLDRGALIVFSKDHNDYPIIKSPRGGFMVAPPVYGFDLENIAITGTGLLDGSGTTWRPVKKSKVNEPLWRKFVNSGGVTNSDGSIWYPSKVAMEGLKGLAALRNKGKITAEDLVPFRDAMRPKMVVLIHCTRVLLDGITIENSPAFAFNPNFCEDMVIRDIKINNEYWAQNGDGIDIGSSRNVLLYKSTVTAGDDGICMKSSHNKYWSGPSLHNIVIADCVVYHAHGGFVTGSNTDGGMHNISVRNCDFVGTDVGLRFKSARDRGGLVDSIYVKNIFMKDIVNEAILFNTYYENAKEENKVFKVTARTPVFKNIFIDSIFCDGARKAASVVGLPEMPIQNIIITNSYISAARGFESDFAEGIKLNNVNIVPERGPVFDLKQSSEFVLNKILFPKDTQNFMSLAGDRTKSISVINTDLKNSETPFIFSGGAEKSAVNIK